jgi:spermidine/putrescine transport system permease protein
VALAEKTKRLNADGAQARPKLGAGQALVKKWQVRWRMGPLAATLPAAAAMGVLFLIPFLVFAVFSVLTGGVSTFEVHGPLTLHNYSEALSSDTNRTLAWNSFTVGLAVSTVTLAVGLPIAYWLRYSAGRWELPVLCLMIAALFGSYLVRVYAWRTILGENGLLNDGLERLGLISKPLGFMLFSKFAVIIALVHIMLPIVILMLYAAFRPLDVRYLEAAQDLGASGVERWMRVILPVVAAPAVTAFLFVFILSAADYVTPQFLGGTKGSLIGLQIQQEFQALGDYAGGAALAMCVLLAFLLLYLLTKLVLRLLRLDRIEWGT